MLSRIAESLYWMSRYLERVDSTARLIEINLIYMLEAEVRLSEAAEWRPLLAICGQEEAYRKANGEEVTARRVIDFMSRDAQHHGSIRTSLRLARENARVVRDRISREMWECINDLWLKTDALLRSPMPQERAVAFCKTLRSEVARFHGLTVSTMMRGEAFGFYLLGFFLERSDMTARILDVKYHLLLPDLTLVGSPLDYYQWASLLRSMSAFEPFRRKYHVGLRPLDVGEFMILESDFPRSLRFAVDRMRQALEEIGVVGASANSPAALKAVDDLLQANTAEKIFAQGLHEYLDLFVARISELHEALEHDYFEAHLGEAACAT
jgi:uncharacterized alpha-E superfamily protein